MNLDLDFGDLYSDVYYDANDTNYNETIVRDYGTVNTLFRGSLVLLLRAGFVLIQIGCIPITDVHIILLQNIIEIACGTIAYGLSGYVLSFGYDAGGVIGTGSWIANDDADMDNAVLGWSAIIVAMAIFTTMVAGRLHCVGYVIIAIIMGGILQPLLLHWVWAKSGWMHRATFVGHNVSYKDQGGGALIHVFGGILALFGVLFLGRRLLRLQDLDESSLPPGAPASVVAGYFLLILGLMGICVPSPSYEMTHMPENYIGHTLINNIMSAAGGIITVVILQFIISRDMLDHWIMLRCMQGAIAGIVTIAPGVDVYKPLVAFAISIPAGAIFYFLAHYLYSTAVEDYANIIPIHLVCGLIGTILPPLCGSREGLGATHKAVIHLGWQVICDIIILLVVIIPALLLFIILKCIGFLRNHSEEQNHRRALTVVSRGPPRTFFQRLFSLDDSTFLQPGYRTKDDIHLNNLEEPSGEVDYSQDVGLLSQNASGSKQESSVKNAKNESRSVKLKATTDLLPSESESYEIKEIPDNNSYISENEVQSRHIKKIRRQIYTLSTPHISSPSKTESGMNVEGEFKNITGQMKGISYYDSDSTDEEVYSYTTRAQIYPGLHTENSRMLCSTIRSTCTPYNASNEKKQNEAAIVSFVAKLPRVATPFRPSNPHPATPYRPPNNYKLHITVKKHSKKKLHVGYCPVSKAAYKLKRRKSHHPRAKQIHSISCRNVCTKLEIEEETSQANKEINENKQNLPEINGTSTPTECFQERFYKQLH